MVSEDKLSTAWSTLIQRPETLYKTRVIRFHDDSKDSFLKALGFQDGMNILEVGCGPGAFSHALERWLPGSKITGLDRDSVFIEYATKKSGELGSKCNFVTGDALNLHFPDNTFDATTSHTVLEHVETTKFLKEQFRVLRPGGIFTALCVRISIPDRDLSKAGSEEEKALWDRIEPYFKASGQKYGIARYSINEPDLAKKMMETGFHQISINFLVQTRTPDNADIEPALAKAMIEAARQGALDGVAVAQALALKVLSDAEIKRLIELVNSRFDERIRLYETGQKVWDISASVLMVARGYK